MSGEVGRRGSGEGSREETTSSAGVSRESASANASSLRVSSTNSPVLRSTAANPARPRVPVSPLSSFTATIQLFREPATQPSWSKAPGVIVSTTSRRTRPRASLGSSTCSQMATRWPAPTSCRRYSVAALTGTPAKGTPSPREVSAMSRIRAASSASSLNIS
jgi:hypothetical protein